MDDAIECILDGNDKLSGTLEICGYTRRVPSPESEATHALDRILEGLDEEYGDPDGGYAEATDRMKEAALEFAKTVLDEYTSWACEIVKRETVNPQEWIRKNRPDWLEDKGNG